MKPTSEPSTLDLLRLHPLQQRQARHWLHLGVLALAIAGIFALLLVLSRVPGASQFFPWIDFFRTALVIHVDQSVLIWFLAMAGVIWSVADNTGTLRFSHLGTLSFALSVVGTLLIAVSAFFGEGSPLMNNYVPVLQRPLFFIALGLFGAGIAIRLVLTLICCQWKNALFKAPPLQVAAISSAVATAIAIGALGWSWIDIPASISGQGFYELLFWGAGHSLQFAFSQMLLLAWILLAIASGVPLIFSQRWLGNCLWIGLVPVLLVPLIYLYYPTVSAESRIAFTRLMQYGGALAAVPVGLVLLWGLKRAAPVTADQRPLRLTLIMSMVLFGSGGVIALMISGINTIIPAHYHGSIVGVTLALMGLAYLLLPYLGYKPITGKLACAQPLCYGFGQLLHITGLALSGAIGIQRKTAGAAQGLDSLSAKMAMGVMGIGGLLAIIGGILFVWIMLVTFFRRRT
ncbi:MAG: cbb3-type cytochrome c oxidase subunit I [Motiliproteus sp.]